jgi:ferredoxin
MGVRALTRGGERLLPGGGTLMVRALAAGLPVASSCSGRGACARCVVAILEGEGSLCPMEAREAEVLARNGVQPHHRLACQTTLPSLADVLITTGYW